MSSLPRFVPSLGCRLPHFVPSLQVGPQPTTFGGQRRLIGHRDEPLLLEVVLARVRPATGGPS